MNSEGKGNLEVNAFDINSIFTILGKKTDDNKAKIIIQTNNFDNIAKVIE